MNLFTLSLGISLLFVFHAKAICLNRAHQEVTLSFSDCTDTISWVLTEIDGTDLNFVKKGDFQGYTFCYGSAHLFFHIFDLSQGGYPGTYSITVGEDNVVQNQTLSGLANAHILDIVGGDPTEAPTVTCSAHESKVEVILDVDSKPEETVWQMISLSEGTVASGEGAGVLTVSGPAVSEKTFTASHGGGILCLECNTTYIFSIQDCGGDGICCDSGYGRYSVIMNDHNQVASGGEFAYTERTFFTTVCDEV